MKMNTKYDKHKSKKTAKQLQHNTVKEARN